VILNNTTTDISNLKVLSMKNDPYYPSRHYQRRQGEHPSNFGELEAAELYCPKCSRPVPVNKFLLLILPEGDKYEYRCRFCGSKVGAKTDRSGQFYDVLRG
jgi:DNA-directed RNA polymerase subunit RPC12/RpoP